jgi:ABC-type transport system substrate-binding protein
VACWLAAVACVLQSLAPVGAVAQTIRFSPGTPAPTAFNPATSRYEEGASFDPVACAEQPCVEILHNIFEGLVSVSEKQIIEPALATNWERLDDRRFRFTLRQGVTFHNGDRFDAEAVRFSLERASEAYSQTAWFPEVEHVHITGPYTVDVVLKEPDSLFLHRLGHLGLIRPPGHFRQVGPAAFGEKPVGTGAFRFVRWNRARREVEMEAYGRYWRAGYPKVKRVIYSYVDPERALDLLNRGQLDLIRRLNPRKTTQFMATGAGMVVKAWLPQFVLGPFNLLKPGPLRDLRVRQAINLAINREDVIRYGTIGNGRPLGGYTVPEDPNHGGLRPYPFDPAKARELLRNAGHDGGLNLSMLVSKEVPPQVDSIIAASLRQVGITLTFKTASEAEFLDQLYLPKFKKSGPPSFDVLLLSMPAGTIYHSGNVPMTLLYSRKANESAVEDPVLDRLYEEALRAPSGAEVWKKLERHVHDNHLLLVGYQERAVFGANRRLRFTPRTLMTFWDAYYER